MNEPGLDNLDLATVNGMMNLCEAKEQAKLDEAAAIAEPEKRREAYARRLREFYAKEGVTMSEETIQKSVDEYLENEMAFQEPRGGLAGFLAALFIYRLWVSLLVVFLALFALAGTVTALVIQDQLRKNAFTSAEAVTSRLEGELKDAQDAVAGGEQTQALNAKNRQDQLAAKALPALLRDPQAELDQEIARNFAAAEHELTLAGEEAAGYRRQIAGTTGYHSKTIAGWQELDQQARAASGKIEADVADATSALATIAGIQKKQTTLDSLGRLWQSLGEQIASLPPKWKTSAQASLDVAAGKLAQGDITADNSLQAARQCVADGARWGSLAVACQTELDASRACQARDAAAKNALSTAQSAVQQALTEQDLDGAAKSVKSLKDTVTQINQAYEVRIVCRTGYRSVIQRTEHQSHGNRYYAIVESVNHDGAPIPRRIQNRESGAFLETAMWGQEIPRQLYDDLYHEKARTGAIQDLSFGVKEPGYLEPQFTRAPGSNHEITSW